MKHLTLLLLALLPACSALASGTREEVALKDRLDKRSWVYAVTITGTSKVTIKELKTAAKSDTEISGAYYYSAAIAGIISRGESSLDSEEPWTMLFSARERATLKKAKESGAEKIGVSDTVFIMDAEDLSCSMTYYVEGRHKIFIYYYCADASAEIKPGKSYIFISNSAPSRKNGVFYGNVGYGLYPDTKAMRKKIKSILAPDRF